jgi:uncharacterized membrane protein
MTRVIRLLKGFPGKPSHPPLTDASIGAYTVGVAMLVLGALGVEEREMAHGALLAIGGGLALAAPTALTGVLDWLDIPAGTPRRTTATIHMLTMLTAAVVFLLAFLTHLNGYDHGRVEALPLVLGIVAETLLAVGGYIGGSLVFVYGNRVLDKPDVSVREALTPPVENPEEEPT